MVAIEHGAAADLNPGSLERMRADLPAWVVQSVVVGPMRHQATMVALFTELLGRPRRPARPPSNKLLHDYVINS